MGGQFAGGAAALSQAPDDAELCAGSVDFHDAEVGGRVQNHVAHIFPGAGHQEILPGQVFDFHADVLPVPFIGEGGFHSIGFLGLHAVGIVAAVAFVPALAEGVVSQADKALHKWFF